MVNRKVKSVEITKKDKLEDNIAAEQKVENRNWEGKIA